MSNLFQRSRIPIGAIIKLGITLSLFVILIKRVNIAKAVQVEIKYYSLFVLAFILAILLVFLQGLRWHLLLKSIKLEVSLLKNIKSVWAGHFLNNALPTSTAGDIVRSYSLRNSGATNPQWISALIIEKLYAIVTALLLASICMFASGSNSAFIYIKLVVLICFALSILSPFLIILIARIFSRFYLNKLLMHCVDFTAAIGLCFKTVHGWYAISASIAINIVICCIFFLISAGLGNELTILQCLFVVPVFTILAGLPISYGGWGVRELSSIPILGLYGIPEEVALTLTILFGLTIFTSSLPGIFLLKSFKNKEDNQQ